MRDPGGHERGSVSGAVARATGSRRGDAAMAKRTTTRKRNPQDATRRNVQAANRRFARIEAALRELQKEQRVLTKRHVALVAGGYFR